MSRQRGSMATRPSSNDRNRLDCECVLVNVITRTKLRFKACVWRRTARLSSAVSAACSRLCICGYMCPLPA